MEIPKPIEAKFNRLCDETERLMNDENYDAALQHLNSAIGLLPEPIEQWDTAVWALGARAHCHFHQRNFEACKEDTRRALSGSADPDSAIAHMRLGQCELELGNREAAVAALERAYELEGPEQFLLQDPKYFEFLQANRPAPADGWY